MPRLPKCVLLTLAVSIVGLVLVRPAMLNAQRRSGGASVARQAGPFGALQWRNIGPLRGGRSIAVAGSSARPLEYYFGATGGGLWKSRDGGTTWRPVTDGQLASSSVGAVAVAPSNPDIVYIGTGESELRGNVAPGDGIYKSSDAGRTWTHIGLTDAQNIAKIRVHPTNPDIVYVAAFGHYAAPNQERGIFRTRDGGRTWDKILYRDDKSAGIEVVLDPNDPQVVFASLWEAYRVSDMMSSGGPGSGLFKSTDGGDHWAEISRAPGMPKGVLGKIGVGVSGADSRRVYAQVEAEDGGTFASDDAGATWTKVSDNRDVRQRAFYYTRVFPDPKDKDTLYEPNVGFMKSTDGGRTWSFLRPPHGDNHDMWIDPKDPNRFIASNDGGAIVTINRGETFTSEAYATAQFYHVELTGDAPYHVCGAQQDNTTACVSSRDDEGSRTAPVFYSVGGGECGYIANDPRNPDIFYAGNHGGQLTRFNRRTGQTKDVDVYPDNPMGYASKDIEERFQWTFPIVFSPADPKILYTASQHLFRSTDGGHSWMKISPDLSRHDPKTMGDSGGPITRDETGVETYATIFTVAPSPRDVNQIWTGSDDGYVQLTRDGGRTWKNVTPKELPEFSRISLIEASPFRPGTAYVAANHYQHDDLAPYVYRTDDFGESWTRIVNGVAPRDYARAIREDPKRAKLLYLGTEHGIYVSFDDGAHWQSLGQNLPDTPVHDIKVADRDLVIATHGRAFWIMDGIGPLRQWTEPSPTLTVFKPQDGLRGLDKSVPIDYVLKQPAQKVTIELLDAQGKVIHTYAGTATDNVDRTATRDDELRRYGRDPRVPVAAGLNRLNWDMSYAGPTEFEGLIMWAANTRGPIAPPGTYQVRITADGQSAAQSFAIRREPHILADVTDADLQKEFELAMQIRDKTSAANEGVLLVRGIRPQIKDRQGKLDAKTGATAKALNDLEKNLTAVEEELYQTKNQSREDPLNFPVMLNNKIASLQSTVESSDDQPTEQTYEVLRVLTGRLDEQLNRLDTAVKTDLPRVNGMLQRQKLEPIRPEPARSGQDDKVQPQK